jgi:hypothetical protein
MRELVIPGTSYIAAVLHGKQQWPEAFDPEP